MSIRSLIQTYASRCGASWTYTSGEVIRIDGLGSFQAVAGSKGSETAEAFQASLIKKPKLIFRPSTILKRDASDAKIEKITIVPTAPDGGGDGPIIEV